MLTAYDDKTKQKRKMLLAKSPKQIHRCHVLYLLKLHWSLLYIRSSTSTCTCTMYHYLVYISKYMYSIDDIGCRSGRCSDERSAHLQQAQPLARLALPAARAPSLPLLREHFFALISPPQKAAADMNNAPHAGNGLPSINVAKHVDSLFSVSLVV